MKQYVLELKSLIKWNRIFFTIVPQWRVRNTMTLVKMRISSLNLNNVIQSRTMQTSTNCKNNMFTYSDGKEVFWTFGIKSIRGVIYVRMRYKYCRGFLFSHMSALIRHDRTEIESSIGFILYNFMGCLFLDL